MQPGKSNLVLIPRQLLTARWSDRQALIAREQKVELVRKILDEWVVRSPVAICEQTQLYLTGDNYTGNGIVCSCHQDDSEFLLTISVMIEESFYPLRQEFDPGILGIDNFLTEEEETKILDSLGDEMPYTGMLQRVISEGILHVRLATRSAFHQLRQTALYLFLPSHCL